MFDVLYAQSVAATSLLELPCSGRLISISNMDETLQDWLLIAVVLPKG